MCSEPVHVHQTVACSCARILIKIVIEKSKFFCQINQQRAQYSFVIYKFLFFVVEINQKRIFYIHDDSIPSQTSTLIKIYTRVLYPLMLFNVQPLHFLISRPRL